jgi:putative FmdB family regulatory protein
MPIYEFHCTHCQENFESLMKPWEPAHCPKCNTSEVNKVPSVIGGYSAISNNGASERPKSAGSRPKGSK